MTSALPFSFKEENTLAASFPEKYQPAWGTIPPNPLLEGSGEGVHPSKYDSISLWHSLLSTGYHPLGNALVLRFMALTSI
jgi:hypothetical protein